MEHIYFLLGMRSMERKSSAFAECAPSLSIRIVADCGLHSYQATRKLKQATTVEFTTISAIIFIHCCRALIFNCTAIKKLNQKILFLPFECLSLNSRRPVVINHININLPGTICLSLQNVQPFTIDMNCWTFFFRRQ